MALYRQKDSPYWFADIRVAGQRHRISTKQKVKQKAQQVEAAFIHKLNTGEALTARARAPYLRDYAPRFLEFVDASRVEKQTKRYYRNGWRLLAPLSVAGMRMDAITAHTAATIQVSGSGSNINTALRTLKRMLTVAHEEGVIQSASRIRLAKERQRERLISPEEEQRIFQGAKQPLRDVFLLIFDTGMRPGEVARLRWEHVDFIRGVILVSHGKSRTSRRHLPMSQRVKEMLVERARTGGDLVFASRLKSRSGQPITTDGISRSFNRLRKALGLPEEVVLYCARHTFATDFMGATGDLSKTSKTLGHGNIGITTRYLHPGVADLGTIMDIRNQERHTFGHSDPTLH